MQRALAFSACTMPRSMDSIRNNNIIWRQASFMSLVHGSVSGFDMFGEKRGIEQGGCETIFR